MKKIKYLLLFLILGLLLSEINVFAETNKSSLTVSPPNQEIILIPGEIYEGTINVSNSNDAESNLDYSVTIGSFSQKQGDGSIDDYGTVDTETITSHNRIMEWITLGKESGSVAPNNSDVIPFTIKVPEDAPAGGQYATIAVQDDTKRGDANGNVTIESKTRIAAIIYAEVAGETIEKAEIKTNNVPSFILSSPLEAASLVRNDGNVHTDASFILQVWPLFSGEEICTNEENPTTSLIMPGTEKLHTESCNLPPIGIFRAKQTVNIFGETSIIEKVVFACPLWLLFVIIFAIIMLIMWIVVKVRQKSK